VAAEIVLERDGMQVDVQRKYSPCEAIGGVVCQDESRLLVVTIPWKPHMMLCSDGLS
jgi:hypothetical protein